MPQIVREWFAYRCTGSALINCSGIASREASNGVCADTPTDVNNGRSKLLTVATEIWRKKESIVPARRRRRPSGDARNAIDGAYVSRVGGVCGGRCLSVDVAGGTCAAVVLHRSILKVYNKSECRGTCLSKNRAVKIHREANVVEKVPACPKTKNGRSDGRFSPRSYKADHFSRTSQELHRSDTITRFSKHASCRFSASGFSLQLSAQGRQEALAALLAVVAWCIGRLLGSRPICGETNQ